MNDIKWFERGELPPVGEVVELNGEKYEIIAYRDWEGVSLVVIYNPLHGFAKHVEIAEVSFKPLPTERDVLVEKASESVPAYMNETADSARLYTIGALIDAGWRPINQQTEDGFVVGVMRVIGPLSDDEIHPRQYLMDCLRELHRAGKCFVEVGYE